MSEQDKQQEVMRRALQELRDLRGKLAQYQQQEHEPVAVVAVGCRFPGGCDSPEALWEYLAVGNNASTEVPTERWSLSKYYHAAPQTAGKINTRYGSFINDIDLFDADFFNISAREAEQMDPQQRLLLETSWQTFERTGIDPKTLRNSRTGVYIGCMTQEYSELIKDESAIDVHTGTGNAPSIIAGRLAYYYGLQGPAMVVDTACSSSLMAVNLAVQSLRNRETDMALAGGVNLQLSPRAGITESQAMMLAQDGRCKTFDEQADGIGRGDGVGLVVLKRLSDALKDGDPVCAVIKGTAANHDGRSSGLTVPSERAQEAVLKAALKNARISAEQVGYVEAHGTGTALGDPIEISALTTVLAERSTDNPLYIGSLKTNFGHTEGAAGIAGLIKTVLMLQHKMLPPHINFNQPSSHIPWQDIPIQIVSQLMPWPAVQGEKRRAGVSAFGLSGTNVHIILEQADDNKPALSAQDTDQNRLLKLSAHNTDSLKKSAKNYQHWLKQQETVDINSVCYAAAIGRTDFSHRAVILADNDQHLNDALQALANGDKHSCLYYSGQHNESKKPVMLFTGQGSQYSGMGRDLYHQWPVFKQAVDECAGYLDGLLDIPLQDLMFDSDDLLLQQTAYAQPVIFTFDYALYRLWQSFGLEPGVVMGHSLGEYVAACIAGVFSLKDALQLVAARARLMQNAPGEGAMLSVLSDCGNLTQLLGDNLLGLDIAAVNSPKHCVLSGDKAGIEQAQQCLSEHDIHSQLLPVSHAFHSEMMEPVMAEFKQKLASVSLNRPYLPIISNVTGQEVGGEISQPDYWLKHCRQTVLFAKSIETLKTNGYDLFIECGSRPVLATLLVANDINPDRVVSSVQPDQKNSLLQAVAGLYVNGRDIDWKQLFPVRPVGNMPVLPVYPFSGRRYWLPKQALVANNVSDTSSIHPLLHRQINLADSETIYYESLLSANKPRFLSEHKVYGRYLLPLAAMVEMLAAAGLRLLNRPGLTIKQLKIESPLILQTANTTQVQLQAKALTEQVFEIGIYSRLPDESWQRHLTAKIIELDSALAVAADDMDEMNSLETDQLYSLFKNKQIEYGDSFKILEKIRQNAHTATATVAAIDNDEYILHPLLLDACLQTAGVAVGETGDESSWLPAAIEQIDYYPSAVNAVKQGDVKQVQCYARVQDRNRQASQVDLVLNAPKADTPVLSMSGIVFQPFSEAALQSALTPESLDRSLYQQQWQLLNDETDTAPFNKKILFVGSTSAQILSDKLAQFTIDNEVISPEQVQDDAYWSGQAPDKEPHFIFCATDFVQAEKPAGVCIALLGLILKLEQQGIAGRLTLLTTDTSGLGEKPVCPKQSAAIGLLKTALLEFPLRQWLMLAAEDVDSLNIETFLKALSADRNEQQLAIQGEQIFTARLMPFELEQSESALDIKADKSYLVTGGAGAIGFAVVEWLIVQGARCVVAVGRSGLASIEDKVLDKLTANGAEIIGVAADLSLAGGIDSLQARLKSLPPLAGIIHAAGVLQDSALLNMSQEAFMQPWGAKVNALEYLAEKLPVDELDFFVAFSSMAAITGSPGQGNYAAANAYVDALMQTRKKRGQTALSINWGAWQGAGMSADNTQRLRDKGVELIEFKPGLSIFKRLLMQHTTQVAVMPLRWPVFLAAMPGEVPAFYQAVQDTPLGNTQEAGGLMQRLNQLATDQRLPELEQAVRQLIAQVLRQPDGIELESRQRFFDIGFDSLLAMEFTRQLAGLLALTLPSTLLFDYPTLESLLNFLKDNIAVDFSAADNDVTDDLDEYSEQELSDLLEQRLAEMD